ncbi:hypothetical protein EDI_245900 [Entamoeba dispar SAW760]|uniref:TLDc domain-containing protein n=1 Tax=Entamoeba dispar (strain ATCC PRA-260 / SAW760) TaxID=370354 RepID=B0EEL8_ENTDS|nr:uncharacterized protein EDI_245900 [Entamoeba dispar SAW760]EDR26994.1 hypothetical protein EDI_245900 [Entamoeba dispar SAW760]|eukprot:EDR26994.1 hypothetical protein EDI_245900 [Entamoeba dispar SAW760]
MLTINKNQTFITLVSRADDMCAAAENAKMVVKFTKQNLEPFSKKYLIGNQKEIKNICEEKLEQIKEIIQKREDELVEGKKIIEKMEQILKSLREVIDLEYDNIDEICVAGNQLINETITREILSIEKTANGDLSTFATNLKRYKDEEQPNWENKKFHYHFPEKHKNINEEIVIPSETPNTLKDGEEEEDDDDNIKLKRRSFMFKDKKDKDRNNRKSMIEKSSSYPQKIEDSQTIEKLNKKDTSLNDLVSSSQLESKTKNIDELKTKELTTEILNNDQIESENTEIKNVPNISNGEEGTSDEEFSKLIQMRLHRTNTRTVVTDRPKELIDQFIEMIKVNQKILQKWCNCDNSKIIFDSKEHEYSIKDFSKYVINLSYLCIMACCGNDAIGCFVRKPIESTNKCISDLKHFIFTVKLNQPDTIKQYYPKGENWQHVFTLGGIESDFLYKVNTTGGYEINTIGENTSKIMNISSTYEISEKDLVLACLKNNKPFTTDRIIILQLF